jgi:hypothetical protein
MGIQRNASMGGPTSPTRSGSILPPEISTNQGGMPRVTSEIILGGIARGVPLQRPKTASALPSSLRNQSFSSSSGNSPAVIEVRNHTPFSIPLTHTPCLNPPTLTPHPNSFPLTRTIYTYRR